ncbi:MAG: 7,8-dihydro-8-oxoguanine triphosphatase [bacterium]|nr:MAG: 7,8-dihydro-8-oxoguanine triphosphatase [bacterium]
MAAGVIRRGDYVLIARRLAEAHLGGFWEFPGGTREEGETLEECLVREIKEELDLVVRVGRHALTVRQEYPDRSLDLHFYLCTPVEGTPEAIGCAEFRWVTIPDLSGFEFPPADRPLIEQLQAVPGN